MQVSQLGCGIGNEQIGTILEICIGTKQLITYTEVYDG